MNDDGERGLVQITRMSHVREEEFYPIIERTYEEIWGRLMPPQFPTERLSSKLANRVVTPPETPVPDCVTCGACCQSLLCVGVRPSDTVDEDLTWSIVAGDSETGEAVVDRYMRRDEETMACTALQGVIGEKVGCSIYETRPRMCHDFDAGSDRCHAIRRAFGIEPFLSLDEMQAAQERLADKERRDAEAERETVIRNTRIRPDPESGHYRIDALLSDESLVPLHEYDPERETWMQFELEGFTISEAAAVINARSE